MNKVFYACLFLPTFLTAAQAAPTDQDPAIKELIESHYSAWNQHDAKKMAEAYAPDGDLRTPWNDMGKSRKEIEAIFAAEFAKQMKNARIDHTITSIRLIKPDLAFADVESTITGMQASDQKQYSPLHHHVVYLLIKRDGKWEILTGRPF